MEGETRTEREGRRGDWQVRIRTRTRATSTATEFLLEAELDAWEGKKRLFSQNCDRRIPRDFL